MCPPNDIHRSSVESGKAPGKLWVRVCSQSELIGEYQASSLQDSAPYDIHERIQQALAERQDEVVLSYTYSGATGECLQTVATLKDGMAHNELVSLSSVGFVPIGEPQRVEIPSAPTSPARVPDNDFQNQWTTVDDQRFLIRTVNGGYPSTHERFIARTISQFLQRNAIEATIIQIVSTYSAAIPQLPPSIVVQIALTLPNAQSGILKLLSLDRALQFLYNDQVECQFHIYREYDSDFVAHHTRHQYLHHCFSNAIPALILGLTAARLTEYFQNRMTYEDRNT